MRHSADGQSMVVIGAGIVGMATALWLIRHGVAVTVIDRLPPGRATSFGNAGTFATYAVEPIATPGILAEVPRMLLDPAGPLAIRWSYVPRLTPWLIRFLRASAPGRVKGIMADLATLLARVEDGTAPLLAMAGADDLIVRRGALHVFSDTPAGRLDRLAALHRAHGVPADPIDADTVHDLEPALSARPWRGLFFPAAHHTVDPLALTESLAAAFRQAGGRIERAEVAGIDACESGERVRLSDGRAIDTHGVAVCAGPWSRTLARRIGDRIPLDTERGYHVMFADAGTLLSRPVCWHERGFYATPMSGGLRIAGTVELGGLAAPPRPARFDALERGARTLLPITGAPASTWMGFRPSMPDSKPVIGRSPRRPTIFYAFGHGHLGLTLAGITGRLIAELATDRPPLVDPAPFAPDRF